MSQQLIGEIYIHGLKISFLIIIFSYFFFFAYRFYNTFTTYARGDKLDTLDESVLLDSAYKAGNRPSGILIDMFFYFLLGVLIVSCWPVAWPTIILTVIAVRLRKNALAQQEVVDALKSEDYRKRID